MKKKNLQLIIVFLCTFIGIVGCTGNMDDTDKQADLSTISGTLSYNQVHKWWEISVVSPNTIDEVTVYVVKKYEIELSKDTKKAVTATGKCYSVDDATLSEEGIFYPAGTTVFYFELIKLN